jgi:glycosyltransferase involved in cell wall biosynthesis
VRVALLHYTYAPVIGGVERIMAAHAQLFARAGHEVTVLCREGSSHDPAIKIVRLPEERSAYRAFLAQALATTDVVFIHNVCTMPFDPALTAALWEVAGTLRQARFVCWIHDLVAIDDPATHFPIGHAPARFAYVAISEYRAQQFAEKTGIMPVIVPNGIDVAASLGLDPEVAALAQAHRLFDRDIVLLQPARLVARKRVELGLQILRALRLTAVDAALLVTAAPDPHNAAPAPLRAIIDQHRAGLEPDALFLHEALPITDMRLAQCYRLADALLLPSRDEGFALPLLEAALHRLPVFCTSLAPMREHALPLHPFPPDADPATIAQMIARILGDLPAVQARKRVARDFAWETIFRTHLAPLLEGAPNQNRS